MSVRVLLAGGGTAGHTSPLLATADALRRIADVEVSALGTARGLETQVVPAAGYRLDLVPAVPLPRRPSGDLVKVPPRLWAAIAAAGRILDRRRPDVVAGFGGYVCVPVYLAAKRRGLPLVVHEGNALPGIANRLGARLTSNVATSFPGTALPHAIFTGLPVRRMVSTLDRQGLRARARAELGLDADRPTLLVFGGSQGARRLNESLAEAAIALAAAGVQVLHVSGAAQRVTLPDDRGDVPYVVIPYLDRMDLGYAAADAVVCRAGANTVTEVACVGLPAVFVPLPHGNGEQEHNARPVVDAGGGMVVPDSELTPGWVRRNLPALLRDDRRLAAMSAAAADLVPRDGDERLATMVLRAAGLDTEIETAP